MKALTSSLKFFVVQKLQVANPEAVRLILCGQVLVNGCKGSLTQKVLPEDEVTWKGKVIKAAEQLLYLAYYKPRGVESTLNPAIENNLAQFLSFTPRVFPVGRLDKDSEGLMLLTNDGRIYDRIIHADSHQEKTYAVTVDHSLRPEDLEALASGIRIMGKMTRPAQVTQLTENSFAITLTQGMNRQIRRMCYKLNYQVVQLVRTRIMHLMLGELQPGAWRPLTPEEVQQLRANKAG